MDDKSHLTLVMQPQAYFHELVTSALGAKRIATQPETEFYLVNLLNQFMTTENLYARDSKGNMREEPLALMMKEALEQQEQEARSLLLRHVGDVSLYVAGFFQESLQRKLVALDYYIEMGGAAYQRVAAEAVEKTLREMYSELADRFSTFVNVFAEVSEQTTPIQTEKDLLQLYEAWKNTGSQRAAKALQKAGIRLESASSSSRKKSELQ